MSFLPWLNKVYPILSYIKLRPVCHRLIIDPIDIMTESVDLI